MHGRKKNNQTEAITRNARCVEKRAVPSQRVTINEPWALDLPQKIVDHFEQTSALTGIEPSKLIAATLITHFESVSAKPIDAAGRSAES